MTYCAIDFGTSNSALAYAGPESTMPLAHLEGSFTSIPTAVFYGADDNLRSFGHAAIAAYVDGFAGRLMRSIKSILGSDLMEEATEIEPGLAIHYIDVVVIYLRHLREVAERQRGAPLTRVVLGRPVRFVDDDARRDAQAQDTLATAARAAGFEEIMFQFEPIAAALDYESRCTDERLVLVADIGGGTSDFSVVRASPQRHGVLDRSADVLANHGVHIAGTDFDRSVSLAAVMPALGYGSLGPDQRPVPTSIYFELATWHLINLCYRPNRMIELRQMRTMYTDERAHARLLGVLAQRLGHELAARAEQAKIDVSTNGRTTIDLALIEAHLAADFDEARQARVLAADVDRIVVAAREAARLAGVPRERIDAVYFTGGSTGLASLTARIAHEFARAENVHGDRFASVVGGLAIYARNVFGNSASDRRPRGPSVAAGTGATSSGDSLGDSTSNASGSAGDSSGGRAGTAKKRRTRRSRT